MKHQFAIYFENLPLKQAKSEIIFSDPIIFHRITRVLKLQEDENFLLFNSKYNLELKLNLINRDKISCKVINFNENKFLLPKIHWILPFLEKKAFEEMISNLTVLGATYIYPVVTEKVHRQNFSSGEIERLNRIMISAAEQSKQFILPQIMTVNSLNVTLNILKENLEKNINSKENSFKNNLENDLNKTENILKSLDHQVPKIFFDPEGDNCFKLISSLKEKKNLTDIICMIGPEGDLTKDEKEFLKENNFSFYALTPTILRAELATTLATGILRSLF